MLPILFVMLTLLSGNICYINCLCWLSILDKYWLVMLSVLSGYADISGWLFYLVSLAGWLCCLAILTMLSGSPGYVDFFDILVVLAYWLCCLSGYFGRIVLLAMLAVWLCSLA